PTAEMQHGWRRNGDFRHFLSDRLQQLEISQLHWAHMAKRSSHLHARGRKTNVPASTAEAHRDATPGFHALQLLEEVDMKIGTPEFAVCNAFEAQAFLETDDVTDRGILDLAQFSTRQAAVLVLFSSLQKRPGTQETADVVGAKRRLSACRHG